MDTRSEAAKVCANLNGDHPAIARYIVERCGSFVYDRERADFIVEFLRAAAEAEVARLRGALERAEAERAAWEAERHDIIMTATKQLHAERAAVMELTARLSFVRGNDIPPTLEGARQSLVARLGEAEAALLAERAVRQQEQHYEAGSCPHCGAWVDFAQEEEIRKLAALEPPSQ